MGEREVLPDVEMEMTCYTLEHWIARWLYTVEIDYIVFSGPLVRWPRAVYVVDNLT